MTTLTIRFNGVQEQILDRMVKTGVAQTKSEAIRMALLAFASQMRLLDDKAITAFLRAELSKNPRSPEEILSALETAKNEGITR
ncbi:hypothetical protein HY993_00565 [Candidatus Micrarchaeota archaeon]|nr:hypothetical protein [Candidatus Micrarchaeota archaeon]